MKHQMLAGIFIFCSVFLVVTSYVIRIEKKRNLFERQIKRDTSNKNSIIFNLLLKLIRPFMPEKAKMEEISYYLDELNYKNISPERIYVYTVCGGIILGVLYFAVLSLFNIYLGAAGIFFGIITGYHMPLIYLKKKYEDIQMEKQIGILPYVEMLEVACEAGLPLTLAIERVHEYYPSPISLEFKKANNDFMANIKTRRESLLDIIKRVGGDDIRLLIESIIQSIDTGTPIKNTLKSLADTIRRELRKSIINKGQKAKWKNFAASVLFQFPPYLFIISGPAMAGLMNAIN